MKWIRGTRPVIYKAWTYCILMLSTTMTMANYTHLLLKTVFKIAHISLQEITVLYTTTNNPFYQPPIFVIEIIDKTRYVWVLFVGFVLLNP